MWQQMGGGDLRISLLGGFRAEVSGRSVPEEAWRRSSARAVVKVLALQPGHRLHREELTNTLWTELDQTTATGRLSKALHFARRALSAEHIRLHGDLLSLEAATLWVDVDAFDDAVRRGDTEEALALYVGDLLPEDRFADWVETRRAQLRASVVRLLLDHASAREASGDPRGALASLERLVAIDALHEDAHARLMRLAAVGGDRHVALRWYTRLVAGLRDELGVNPTEDLRRLHGDIAAGRLGPRVDSGIQPVEAEPVGAAQGAAAPAVDEERKVVTVLAADLRGVRSEAGDADPERSRRTIGAWTDVIAEVLGRWNATVERLVGGGAVAVFGYPAACEDHADRALWAGFEVLQRVPVSVRIGIDTGEVIAPSTGAMSLSDIGGDVLDSAARLREAARPRALLATERTRRAARSGDFHFGDALRLDEPGAEPLLARRLLSADWATYWRQPADEPPLVGREDEMRAILSLVDEAEASGRPRFLTVVGAAGIGKSRLVREVVSTALQRRPETRVLRGRCLAAGDGVTYWALGEILREACGIAHGDAGEVAQEKLQVRLRELLSLSQLDEAEVDATIFALAATAVIRLPDNPLDSAPPRVVAEELARAWPRFATASAARGPVLIVIEDLHWAGAPLVDMLARLAARSSGPLVLLTTARPETIERHPGLGTGSADMSMISLRSLTEGASRLLLSSLPRAQGLPHHRRDEILDRAEGNPYFLDQLVAHLADGEAGALPDTLHTLLAARVDALPALEKRLLLAAAVVGRSFWLEPLRKRLGQDDVTDALLALEDRGLVVARPTTSLVGHAEFAFKHALLRDVAYASLPAALRARGHADTAAWIEDLSRERAGEYLELIAYHYAAAADSRDAFLAWSGEPEQGERVRARAFRSLIEAGASASRRFAVRKALDLHYHALQLAAGIDERAEAMEAIGDDHEASLHGDAAIPVWEEALALLRREAGQDDRRARLCLKAAEMAVARWGGFRVPPDPALSDRLIDEGLSIAREPSVKAQLLALRANCGARWAWTGRPDPRPPTERREAAETARRLAIELGSAPLQGLALFGLAAGHFIDGAYDEGVAAVLAEVDLMDQGGGRGRDRALAHAVASHVMAYVRGAYEHALVHARMSHALSTSLSPHDRLHGTFSVMMCLEHLGRWSEMDPFLDEHLDLLRGPEAEMACPFIRGGPLVGAIALSRLGEVRQARDVAARVPPDMDHPGYAEAMHARFAIEIGEVDAARALCERLVRVGRRPGPLEIPPESLVLVEALHAQGDWDALGRFLPTARSMSGFLAALTPTCDLAEGKARFAAGAVDDADVLLARAIEGFDRLSLRLEAARAREYRARVVPIPGRARDLLRSALDAYMELGAGRDVERAQGALAAG